MRRTLLLAMAVLIAGAASPLRAQDAGKQTYDRILGHFTRGNDSGVRVEQIPPSPVPLGARDIRFRVFSPVAGTLVLLSLSDKGELIQLFPNPHLRGPEREGVILAGSSITVPDAYYGIRFDATAANSGTIIALVTNGPVEMPPTVKTRKIEVIPAGEVEQSYVPALETAISTPSPTPYTATVQAVNWSVATLRFKIGY